MKHTMALMQKISLTMIAITGWIPENLFFFKVEVYISGEVEETIADDDYDEDDGEEELQHDGDKCNEEDDEDDDGEDNVEDDEDGEGDGGDDDGYR